MPLFGPPNVEKLKAKGNIQGLIKALKHENEDIRRDAASALGELGDRQAVEPLIAALDDSREVSLAATEALGKIGDERAVKALIPKLKDLKWLSAGTPAGRAAEPGIAAARALVSIGTPALELLVTTLRDRFEDIEIREGAAQTLGMIGSSQAIDGLMTALEKDFNNRIRRIAGKLLHDIGDARIVDRLLTLVEKQDLEGEDRSRKIAAIMVLGGIGDARAVQPLIAALNDEDTYIAKAAATALGEIGDLQAAEPLVASFGRDKSITDNACVALAKIGPPAMDAIIAGLKHPDDNARSDAARVLNRIGDERAIPALRLALDDDVHFVRVMVEAALKSIEARTR